MEKETEYKPTVEEDPMIDTKEMAKLRGVSPVTIYHEMERGELPWPYYQVTRTKRVSKLSDVLAWLENVCVKPISYKKNQKEVSPSV